MTNAPEDRLLDSESAQLAGAVMRGFSADARSYNCEHKTSRCRRMTLSGPMTASP